MTKIHVPLKFKVKSIQQSTNIPPEPDPEINDRPLSINLKGNSNNPNLSKVNLELSQRVEMLEKSLQQAREEAFQSGIEEGKEQVRKEMEVQLLDEINAMKTVIDTISTELTKEVKKLQPVLLKLSKIAGKILEKELTDEENINDILMTQIERILHELIDQETITIHVSPTQIDWILNSNLEEQFRLPGKIQIKFYEDRKLKPGECILESTNLLIEGKFKEQLDNIESQLLSI